MVPPASLPTHLARIVRLASSGSFSWAAAAAAVEMGAAALAMAIAALRQSVLQRHYTYVTVATTSTVYAVSNMRSSPRSDTIDIEALVQFFFVLQHDVQTLAHELAAVKIN